MGLVVMVSLLLANFGLTFAVVDLAKEVDVSSGKLVGKGTRVALRTASEELVVDSHGVLQARASGKPVKVATDLVKVPLSSDLPDQYWNELKHIELENGAGGKLFLTVHGVVRPRFPLDGVESSLPLARASQHRARRGKLPFPSALGN